MKRTDNKSWYDAEVDILYIQVQKGNLANSNEITDDIRIDVNERGEIIGIEISHARERVLEPVSSEIFSLLQKSIQGT